MWDLDSSRDAGAPRAVRSPTGTTPGGPWPRGLVPVAVLAGFAPSAASVLAFTAGAGLGLIWLTAVTARLASDPVNQNP
ncbi:hypothetical protein ACFUJR_23780 [Streptomyces sp. NPDC057271]|uniref:hypothetical protein n=1 Tax=unclassified Streptomyces TaxID=2593676 RepID=UPI003628E660